MAKLGRLNTRIHKLLGLIIGAQLILWTASGLFFTLIPIEKVRGEHLRTEVTAELTPDSSALEGLAELKSSIEAPIKKLEFVSVMGEPFWRASTREGTALYSTSTGEKRTAFNSTEIERIAAESWIGDGTLETLALIDEAPREGRYEGKPMWRVDFSGKDTATFWIDPRTGDIAAVRTQHWRLFDLFWGLHIMDWQGRETISSWWMKLFAFGSLVLSLSGVWMLVERARQGRLFS